MGIFIVPLVFQSLRQIVERDRYLVRYWADRKAGFYTNTSPPDASLFLVWKRDILGAVSLHLSRSCTPRLCSAYQETA